MPKWIVAAELLETSRLFGHTVAKIDPEWVLQVADHLVKREHFEPHYHVKSGQVMAYEKISLYGLTLVEKRRVAYGKIDPILAREVFIRQALVEGNYRGKGKFFAENNRLIESVGELEAKSRRRDILVDDEALFRFFDERLPADIVNLAGFEHWRKEAEKTQPKLLCLTREFLMQHDAGGVTEAQFPDRLNLGGIELPLQYHFEPNHADDGVSLMAPVSVLHQIPEHRLEWLVPGLLKEKCIALVKALPKQWRKQFVPVPDYVERALARMTPGNEPLALALGEQLFRVSGTAIDPALWQDLVLDDYYRMNIIVLDENGKRLDAGRDLLALRERYRDRLQANIESAGSDLEQAGLTDFPGPQVATETQFKRGGISIRVYPALVDEGDSVALRMQDNPAAARALHRAGLVRTLLLQLPEATKYLRKELLKGKDIGLSVADLGNREQVADGLMFAAMRELLQEQDGLDTRLAVDFQRHLQALQGQLVPRATDYGQALVQALTELVAVRKALKSHRSALVLAFCISDIKQQLEGLFNPTIFSSLTLANLRQYPRYLKAIMLRLEKAPQNVQRDKLAMAEWQKSFEEWQLLVQRLGEHKAALEPRLTEYRWLLEELRISLFAQSVKTLQPVSGKRLAKLLQDIRDDYGLAGC